MHQALSGSELAIVRLELSSNLLERDAFACVSLFCLSSNQFLAFGFTKSFEKH